MPINAVPERDPMPVQGIGVATPPWLEFFRGVFFAVFGWKRSFTSTAALDFPLIGAGAEASLTIAVTGARVGDAVLVTPASKTAGIVEVGVVTGNDTVTVYAMNCSAAGVNPASKNYRLVVLQQ